MKIINNFNNHKFPKGKGPERIKIDAKCPVCGSLYDFGQLDVIEEEDGATLMYIKCSVCQSAALSIIALSGFGLKVASTITDLERDEVVRFQVEEPLKSEEVLGLHEELEKTDNWLERIE